MASYYGGTALDRMDNLYVCGQTNSPDRIASGRSTMVLQLAGLAPGTYYLQANDGALSAAKPFVVVD